MRTTTRVSRTGPAAAAAMAAAVLLIGLACGSAGADDGARFTDRQVDRHCRSASTSDDCTARAVADLETGELDVEASVLATGSPSGPMAYGYAQLRRTFTHAADDGAITYRVHVDLDELAHTNAGQADVRIAIVDGDGRRLAWVSPSGPDDGDDDGDVVEATVPAGRATSITVSVDATAIAGTTQLPGPEAARAGRSSAAIRGRFGAVAVPATRNRS